MCKHAHTYTPIYSHTRVAPRELGRGARYTAVNGRTTQSAWLLRFSLGRSTNDYQNFIGLFRIANCLIQHQLIYKTNIRKETKIKPDPTIYSFLRIRMQIGHGGLSVPVPLPMWYYNHCLRFPESTLHPAFTRTVFPTSPTSQQTSTPCITNTSECTNLPPTTKSDVAWRNESKPKKNSFSIEAILDIDSDQSASRGNQNESKVAAEIAERRRHRMFENSHPYITTPYPTNHHHFTNTQLPVCQESQKVSVEESVSGRVVSTGHVSNMASSEWKRQHHHHQQHQQHLEPHSSVTLPRAPVKNSSSGKSGKRVRTIFTPEQLEQLEAEFSRQQYMVGTERYYLAGKLALSEVQVKVWFQNRRIKMRKQQQEAIKEHFAQCRYMNASESEEEEEEEEKSQQPQRTQQVNGMKDTGENSRSTAQETPKEILA